MNTYLSDPTLISITRISELLNPLKTLSSTLAWALIGLLFSLEVIEQNIKAVEGRGQLTNSFVRLFLASLGLLLYDKIFNMIMELAQIIEMSILSEEKWGDFLIQISDFFKRNPITILSKFPILITWIASFVALAAMEILTWCRYCLLAVLYFIGPICFSCLVYERIKFVTGSWFRNIVQLSLWTLILRVVVRVMMELHTPEMLASANAEQNFLKISAILLTFTVMILLSPQFAMAFTNGQSLTSFAAMTNQYSTQLLSRVTNASRVYLQNKFQYQRLTVQTGPSAVSGMAASARGVNPPAHSQTTQIYDRAIVQKTNSSR